MARSTPSPAPDGPTGALALRRLRRHWGLLAVCAGFLLAGALVLDDYGVGPDSGQQRTIGEVALNQFAGEGERLLGKLPVFHNRYYGAAFEAPLALVERILGLEDSRDVWLSRHMLTHLFFLVSGVFCYLLVYRIFQNRLLALIAMALFVLHPRLYAHSFFNSKDLPFAAMFMISLYLTHRAFRRETLGAFLVCGVGIGLLVNLRVMGIALFAAVLALRGLDAAFARSREERGRALLTGGAFALTAMLTYYATLPVLWTDPGRVVELVEVLGAHLNESSNLFRGEWLYSPDGPPYDYVPVWVGITTPPAVLLLALGGAIALTWRGVRHSRDILRDGPLRFGLLLIALPVAIVVAIVVLENNVYNGWRQLYFLYAPLLLLAIFGLHWLALSMPGRWMRAGTWALAGTAVAVTVVSMARIHPLEDSYYNGLVDRTTPDWLVSQYQTDYWDTSYWRVLKEVVADHPEQEMLYSLQFLGNHEKLLPTQDRKRVHISPTFVWNMFHSDQPVSDKEYGIRVYNNTISSFNVWHITPEGIEEITRSALSTEPVFRSDFFTVHLYQNMVVYYRESCSGEHLREKFFLHVYPVDAAVLSNARYVNWAFYLYSNPIDSDGRCVAIALLPDWPVSSVHTGQFRGSRGFWSARFSVTLPDIDPAVLAGEPVARSVFDVYRDGDTLVYVRDGCTEEEAGTAFFLHVVPVDAGDLPANRRRYGFDNLGFFLTARGMRMDGDCVAAVPLPAYPIASIATGQYDETGGIWSVELALADGE